MSKTNTRMSNYVIDPDEESRLEKRWGVLVGKYKTADGGWRDGINEKWTKLQFMKFCDNSLVDLVENKILHPFYLYEQNGNKNIFNLLREDLKNIALTEDPQFGMTTGFQFDPVTQQPGGTRIPGFRSDDSVVPKIIFPTLRRMYPNLIANKLIGTQVLKAPLGYIWYFDWFYETAKGMYDKGTTMTAYPKHSYYDDTARKTYYRNANKPETLYKNARDEDTLVDDRGHINWGIEEFYASANIPFKIGPEEETFATKSDELNTCFVSNGAVLEFTGPANVQTHSGVYKIRIDFINSTDDYEAAEMVKRVDLFVDGQKVGILQVWPLAAIAAKVNPTTAANQAAAEAILADGVEGAYGLKTHALIGTEANGDVCVYVDFGNLAKTTLSAATIRPGTRCYGDIRMETASTVGNMIRQIKGIDNSKCIYNDEEAGQSAYAGSDTGLIRGRISTYHVMVVHNQEGTPFMPTMTFALRNVSITISGRKTRAKWTIEAEQDWKAFNNIDVEAEMVKAISQQMNMEIDRETIWEINQIVIPELSFVYDFDSGEHSGYADYNALDNSQNYADRHVALAEKLIKVAETIHRFNQKSPATWVLLSPEVAAGISISQGFSQVPGIWKNQGYSVNEIGNWRGRLTFYVDPFIPKNVILMGYKGDSPYDTGIIYTPYSTYTSKVLEDPYNHDRIRAFFVRDGFSRIPRGQFNYAKITVTGSIFNNN